MLEKNFWKFATIWKKKNSEMNRVPWKYQKKIFF